MWLFRQSMTMAAAANALSRVAAARLLRLRNRSAPLGLLACDGFELEGIALVHAITVFGIEDSKFDGRERDRLQDLFTATYAERILRLQLTQTLFLLHAPQVAVDAHKAMQGLRLTSHDRLDLTNLCDLLVTRLPTYRCNLEDRVGRFLKYLEATAGFETMFSLAVFITDTADEVRSDLEALDRKFYLV